MHLSRSHVQQPVIERSLVLLDNWLLCSAVLQIQASFPSALMFVLAYRMQVV